MNRKAEIKEYERILRESDAEIARLMGVVKHCKVHLKFLKSFGEDETPTVNTTFSTGRVETETLDGSVE